MKRFLLFVGLLVAAAYMLTTPPQEMAMRTAGASPTDDKPLLTSWGRTLGSLREDRDSLTGSIGALDSDGATQTAAAQKFRQYGAKTELWVLGQTNGWTEPNKPTAEARGWASDSYVETAGYLPAPPKTPVAVATVVTDGAAPNVKPPESTDRANLLAARASAKTAPPVVDRIAAARPPQLHGLFGRSTRNRARTFQRARAQTGLAGASLALFKKRKPTTQRAWAIGPAR